MAVMRSGPSASTNPRVSVVLPAALSPAMARSTGRAGSFDLTRRARSMAMVLSGMVTRPLHDEAQGDGLPSHCGLEGIDLYVVVREGGPAAVDLEENGVGIDIVEVRQAPHLPVVVARRRGVGELDAQRPSELDRPVDLRGDLIVGQGRQV